MTVPIDDDDPSPASGVRDSDPPFRADDRAYAIDRWGDRWSTAAIAAAIALPSDTCHSAEDWRILIDRLDAGIRSALGD